ncbi:hypothetical protein SNE40_007710 [Patella caerulea]|uniref:Uncharacterized protein n=1 Tax=Patella caerulea TaxID=87958 RepID=A0AAN8PVF1_PATCE
MEGKNMSVYGIRDLGPTEVLGSWKTIVRNITMKNKEHLATKGDNSGHWSGMEQWNMNELKNLKSSYYGKRTRNTEAEVSTTYERLFHNEPGYNSKLHRDDRKNILTLGIAVTEEETKRPVPVLASSEYGKRLNAPLEPFSRARTRIDHSVKGFYSRRGIGLPLITD